MKTISHLLFFILTWIFIFFLPNAGQSQNHAGGSITYFHQTGNDYLIHLTYYRECFGVPAPTTVDVTIQSAQCGYTTQVTLTPVPGIGIEIPNGCTWEATSCAGGYIPGFQHWEYEAVYSFPGQCSDWVISTSFPSRYVACTTILHPELTALYLEARLNNSVGNNSSPQFSVTLPFVIYTGMSVIINNGAVDIDGDSLVYSLIPARESANAVVTYVSPFTGVQPLSSNPPVNFDQSTGDVYLLPTTPQVATIVYEIKDYRNGQLMGSVMRDVVVHIENWDNFPPQLSGINGMNLWNANVLPNTSFCFDLISSDPNISDTVYMWWINNGIPNATFTITNTQFPVGSFCWSPSINDVRPQPYTFIVGISDHECPTNGNQLFPFSIVVTLDSSIITPLGATGINESFTKGNLISIYPNPANSSLTLFLGPQTLNFGNDVYISNLLGEKIISLHNVYGEIVLSTENLPRGIYLYQVVNTSGGSFSGKFTLE